MKSFGEKLAEARKKAGLTQEQLAEALKMSGHNSVSAWEKNKAKPKGDTLIEISKLLNISLDYLLLDETTVKPYQIPPDTINIAKEEYIGYLNWKNTQQEAEIERLRKSSEPTTK